MQFNFTKWQGCGNDFVLVNGLTKDIISIQQQVSAICNRSFGVGADGVIFILPSQKCDFRMQIFNSDSSEAEMCGNGIRCFARHVYECGLTDKSSITVETKAGIIKPQLISCDSKENLVKVNMGKPILKANEIPVSGFSDNHIISESITVDNKQFKITCVSMGNPHCVVFVDNIADVDIKKWGPVIEKYKIFPNKTNVEFVEVINRSTLRMRVWERGAGITLACGTGACATLTAAVLNNLCEKTAAVNLDGGTLSIEWNETDGSIYMTGPAKKVFEGIYYSE
ncbi:diaminopimelate epimerase [Pectinatus sottacetonis]|uniref:diaminopimelate epimerase n=1 Tax=Pectinatus sottacetonis TaxID=1002795 RepID=UPI0018C4FA56|nr:diaminopimelate epimerase [Pectinatus sottacetonis]